MSNYNRFGNRWTVNECLQLQREFELLELSIDEIANLHQRTPNAIMFKLDQEGFADYNNLYADYSTQPNTETEEEEEEEEEEDTNSLIQRINRLESHINEIASLIIEKSNSGKKSLSSLW